MYNVAQISRWLEKNGGPIDTADSPEVTRYLEFYDLDFPGTRHEMGGLPVGGDRVCVQSFRRRGMRHGTVFLLHGYLDHVGLLSKAIGHLLDDRFDVVAFDQPGHGLSTGDRADVHTFDHYVEALDACIERYREVDGCRAIMGHSMGGAIAMTHLLTRPANFDRAVLIAPLFMPKAWRLLRSAHMIGRHFIERQARVYKGNTRDAAHLHFVREIDPLSPGHIPVQWVGSMFDWTRMFRALRPANTRLLVVQGTGDGTVDWRGNVRVIRRKFPDARIHLVKGGKHHLLNEVDEFREQAWDVIDPFLKEHA